MQRGKLPGKLPQQASTCAADGLRSQQVVDITRTIAPKPAPPPPHPTHHHHTHTHHHHPTLTFSSSPSIRNTMLVGRQVPPALQSSNNSLMA